MKVGMVTFHRACNYGAVLQAYALQKTLKKMDFDTEIINFKSAAIEDLYSLKKNFLHRVKTLEIIPLIKKRIQFSNFINQKMDLTKLINDTKDLKKLNAEYDLFVTGSDQVWCEKCLRQAPAFFLDFVEDSSKKISYAASIGKDSVAEELQDKFFSYVSSYAGVSVREESARKLLIDGTKKDITVHVDPTLLLDASGWQGMLQKPKKKGYILVYTVLEPFNLLDYAKALSEKTGCEIIYLNDRMKNRRKGFNYVPAVSPEQFVGFFSEARYVVTNSFHGTVFSILFHKQFAVEFEAKGRRNIRSEELLKKLHLDNRELTSATELVEEAIDWSAVDDLLDKEREKSKLYFEQWRG